MNYTLLYRCIILLLTLHTVIGSSKCRGASRQLLFWSLSCYCRHKSPHTSYISSLPKYNVISQSATVEKLTSNTSPPIIESYISNFNVGWAGFKFISATVIGVQIPKHQLIKSYNFIKGMIKISKGDRTRETCFAC